MVNKKSKKRISCKKLLTIITLFVSPILIFPLSNSSNFLYLSCSIPLQSTLYSFQSLIIEVTQIPLEVEYYQSANVTAVILNNSIATVVLTYRTEGGNWNRMLMTNLTSSTYVLNIPPQPWDTFVQYYVNVTDIFGFSTIADNNGSYYNYRVVDTIPPVVQITSPTNTTVFYGIPHRVYTSWEDAGSGLDFVEVYIDGILDVTYSGVTSGGIIIVPEGTHLLTFIAYDQAGNNFQLSRRFTYIPDPEPPIQIPGFPFSSIILGFVITIILLVRLNKNKSRNQ